MIDSETQLTNFKEIYKVYREIFQRDVSDYENETFRLVLPILPIPILISLCDSATKVFQDEPILLIVNVDVVVVGDLHGHILDLFRILNKIGEPPEKNYLFLGDFVDRGEFSTETITLILVLKVLFPENVFIIRGNHEFPEMFTRCGFSNELEMIYENQNIKSSFQKCFSYMPLAALVHDSILCVHGGIGPSFNTLGQITNLKRPIFGYEDEVLMSIVWSDPSTQTDTYLPSSRGSGFFFGEEALSQFLRSQVLDFLVRGHECINDGVEYQLNGKMATVFSASNYCGMLGNQAGVLMLNKDKTRRHEIFESLTYLRRHQARFIESEDETIFKLRKTFIQSPGITLSMQCLPALNKACLRSSDSHSNITLLKGPLLAQRRQSVSGKKEITSQVNNLMNRRQSVDSARRFQGNKRLSLHDASEVIQSTPNFPKLAYQPVVPTMIRTQPCPRKIHGSYESMPKPEIHMPQGEQFPSFRKRHFENMKAQDQK